MLYYVFKTILASVIIVTVTEVSKFNAQLGGFIKALPLISVISFIWIYSESKDVAAISQLSMSTLWYVVPTLPMFYIFSICLNKGLGFYTALFFSTLTILPGYIIVTKILNN